MNRRVAARFSRASGTYDAHTDVQRIAAARVAALALRHMPGGSLITDGGCGTGMLAGLLPGYHLIQCDHAEAMVRAAHQRYPHHPAIVADVTALPFMPETLDGYVSSLCWQWVIPLQKAMEEAKRVVRPDGRIIVAMLQEGTFSELAESFHHLGLPERMLTFLPEQEIGDMVAIAGMPVVERETLTHVTYFPTAKAFFHQLRGIGATAGGVDAPPLTRRDITRLMQHYDTNHRSAKGVSVSYHVGVWVIRR